MKKDKKNTQVKMNDVITSLGDIIASTGCRILLYQPKVPAKLANNAKNDRTPNSWWGLMGSNAYEIKCMVICAMEVNLGELTKILIRNIMR